ncbi:hypothetical protein ACIB24_15555 [Spongisporangium articulatum]|uniref:Integral membrane protein n=1 Tax=Spongisporangium articulatum TaxID=3362603 RepID=A0ABW8AQ36_9ACTN
MSAPRRPPSNGRRPDGTGADVAAAAAAVALVTVAAVVGGLLVGRGVPVLAGAAPLFARIEPVLGPGVLLPVAVGALLVVVLPPLAERVVWRAVAPLAFAGALAWTVALALSRGVGGVRDPLTTRHEYLVDVPRIRAGSWHDFLTGFAVSIPAGAPQPWATHVSGHPPGMTAIFVALDAAGLTGPWPASLACLLGWAVAVVAVTATLRRVVGEALARQALPYLVLSPAVVWAGVSADALLAGFGALGVYLLARAATGALAWAVPAGLVLGWCCFLSYGAPLVAVPALAVLVVGARRVGPSTRSSRRVAAAVVLAAGAAVVVVGAFALAGFAWWDGYSAVRGRYLAGFGGLRPYGYWVWADFGALAVAAGPAVAAGLARAGRLVASRGPGEPGRRALALVAVAAFGAVLLAALSGMSKAEVERIWLPWTVWLTAVGALLPPRRVRWWLLAQWVLALAVEQLLHTPW